MLTFIRLKEDAGLKERKYKEDYGFSTTMDHRAEKNGKQSTAVTGTAIRAAGRPPPGHELLR